MSVSPVQIVSIDDGKLKLDEKSLQRVLEQKKIKDLPVHLISIMGNKPLNKSWINYFFCGWLAVFHFFCCRNLQERQVIPAESNSAVFEKSKWMAQWEKSCWWILLAWGNRVGNKWDPYLARTIHQKKCRWTRCCTTTNVMHPHSAKNITLT